MGAQNAIPYSIWGPSGPKMQYLTAFGALKGPNCNTLQHLAPSRAQIAIPYSIWGPQGPKLQYLTAFGALRGPNCNTLQHLAPVGAQIAIPYSISGPQGPKLQYLTAFGALQGQTCNTLQHFGPPAGFPGGLLAPPDPPRPHLGGTPRVVVVIEASTYVGPRGLKI